jgi:hypothetical protein
MIVSARAQKYISSTASLAADAFRVKSPKAPWEPNPNNIQQNGTLRCHLEGAMTALAYDAGGQ